MDNSQTLNVADNLDISKIEIPEIPKDIIFPDELNRFLREQIRYYVHENGMLQKNLSDIEFRYNESKSKIKNLKLKIHKSEKASDGNEIVDSHKVASLKIVDLSKKLREKNSEMEVFKTKNSRLEQYILELKQTSGQTEEKVSEKEEKPVNELEETTKKLQDKLNNIINKLTETRNGNLQLKNDLQVAKKCLQQETGENFDSIQTLISNCKGNWRGRAQIICDLQQKNNELKEKLKYLQEKSNTNSVELPLSKTESKISILSKENNDLKSSYESLKKKYDASRARVRVLDTDYTLLKSKFGMVKDQSERDQDIISTLSSQISNTREIKNDVLKQKDSMINKLQKEKDLLLNENKEYKIISEKIREELQEKKKEIEKLNMSQIHNSCGDNPATSAANNSQLDAETKRLLELIEVQNIRLKAERDGHAKTQSMLRMEKQKSAKAEARIEVETNTARCSGYSTTSLVRSLDINLRDQLELAEENIKALKTRLEIEQFERKTDLQEFTKILQNVNTDFQ